MNSRNRPDVKCSNALSNLALKLGRCFGSVLSRVFCLEPHEKVEYLCNKVRTRWTLYQCESELNVSTNEEIRNQDKHKGEANRVSYLENTFKAFDLKVPSKLPKQHRMDVFRRKICAIKDDYGSLKYPQ